MRRHFAGHARTAGLRRTDQRDAHGRRDVRDVERLARLRRHEQIARDDDVFGEARAAGEAEHARAVALVHHRVALEARVLAVLDEHARHVARVKRRLTQHARVGDGRAVVAEGDGAGLVQPPERREFSALAALRDRADRVDAREAGGLREPQDLGDQRGRVERGVRVGHAGHGRESAGDGGGGAGRDRLLVRVPRLAQVHVHVDEAGSDDRACGVDDLGVAEAPVGRFEVFADLGDHAVLDAHVADRVEPLRRIDDAAAADQQVHASAPTPRAAARAARRRRDDTARRASCSARSATSSRSACGRRAARDHPASARRG